MEDTANKAYTAPTVQGFIPVNKPTEANSKKRSVRLQPDVSSKPPPKRQRKSASVDKPAATSNTTRSKRASAKNIPFTRSKTKPKAVVSEPRQSAVAGSSKVTSLSTAIKSRLNAFHLNTVSSSTAETESLVLPQGKDLTRSFLHQDSDKILDRDHGSEKSDDTLSSDLWKNQEPLPNYPWLRGVYPKEDRPTVRAISSSRHQSESPILPAQFFESGDHAPTAQTEDSLMHDSELEVLLDCFDEDKEDSKPGPIFNPIQQLSKVCRIADEDDMVDMDDFLIDGDELDILLEATLSIEPSANPAKPGVGIMSAQNTILQQRPESVPSQRKALATRATPARNAEEDDFDLDADEFDDMIDLLESTPENLSTEPCASSLNQTPSPFKNAAIASQIATPQSTVTLSPPTAREAKEEIHSRFVRPLHPAALQTPSPIPGLSPTKRVLTCFRIGEAINATVKAQRQGSNVFIELYARVLHSIREGSVQTFRIIDLWSSPDRLGIVLEGRWRGWNKSKLWQKDSEVFWRDSMKSSATNTDGLTISYARKCRIIGTLGRKADGGYILDIVSLWEATWDDIEFAKGLILGM